MGETDLLDIAPLPVITDCIADAGGLGKGDLDAGHDVAQHLARGKGQHEAAMIAIIRKASYTGPIGILDHRNDTDTEIALRENLEGLQKILKK